MNIKLIEILLLLAAAIVLPVLGVGLYLLPGAIWDLFRRE